MDPATILVLVLCAGGVALLNMVRNQLSPKRSQQEASVDPCRTGTGVLEKRTAKQGWWLMPPWRCEGIHLLVAEQGAAHSTMHWEFCRGPLPSRRRQQALLVIRACD